MRGGGGGDDDCGIVVMVMTKRDARINSNGGDRTRLDNN